MLVIASAAVIIAIILIIWFFLLPVKIAERKNLMTNESRTITILTWCGLFTGGITWWIALFLAIFYKDADTFVD